MTIDEGKLRTTGWVAVGLVALGQLLPWSYKTWPVEAVWESLFSSVSRPNPEWWIWFGAPAAALVLAAKGLKQQREIPKSVLIPAILFFATWASLILTGVRRYTGLRKSGFLVTFIGLLILGIVALVGSRKKPVAARPASTRPKPRS